MVQQIFAYQLFFPSKFENNLFFHSRRLNNQGCIPVKRTDWNTERRQSLQPQKLFIQAASLRLYVGLIHHGCRTQPWTAKRNKDTEAGREKDPGLSWTPLRRGCGLDDYTATDDVSGGSRSLREHKHTLTYSLKLFCRKGKAKASLWEVRGPSALMCMCNSHVHGKFNKHLCSVSGGHSHMDQAPNMKRRITYLLKNNLKK